MWQKMCNLAQFFGRGHSFLSYGIMEKLMHYVWKHRLWGSNSLFTNDGVPIRVIDTGLPNTDSGPDFFNAKVEIGGELWVGNVEIHVRASDWKRHGHDHDKAYDNVILHVVEKDDAPVYRTDGERIPQMVMRCSPQFHERYDHLVNSLSEIPCTPQISQVPSLVITEWIEALAFERLHGKVSRLRQLLEAYNGSWEDVCYVTLSRNLGFGINNDALERLARLTPLRLLHKHSDSLLQVEALLFGQAGLLAADKAIDDPYFAQLQREYDFLARKFSLSPIEAESWKMFRIRPQNFPYKRIALLAQFITGGFRLMAQILDANGNEKALRELFSAKLSGYWASHFSFGEPSATSSQALSNRSIDIILINTVAPLYYAYGELTDNYEMTDCAIGLLEQLKPEKNSIVERFAFAGIPCDDALTSQALIQLKREYCDAKKCIYCKIGHRLLSQAAVES